MPILDIPKRQYLALKSLSSITDSQFDELVKGLAESEASLNPSVFSKRLAAKTPSISADEIGTYVGVLCGLYPAKENNGKTASEIAADIKETVEDEKPSLFPPEKAELLRRRMTDLLSVDKAIAVTAKAFDVITEHPRVFCGARMFSDIRPVFSASADSVSAAAVVHTLNISFHEGRDHKEFYVALDSEDIDLLGKIIERAKKKSSALQGIIQKSGITYLEQGQ